MHLFSRTLSLLPVLLASSCVSAEGVGEIPGCRVAECVGLGTSIEIGRHPGDLVVTPLNVIEDSRCPIEANCIWAGRVVLDIELRRGNEVIGMRLTTENPVQINGGSLSIAEVAPDASENWMPVPSEAYRFGFAFEPDAGQ